VLSGDFHITWHHVPCSATMAFARGCNIACWLLVCYDLPACTQLRRAYAFLACSHRCLKLWYWCFGDLISYYCSKDMLSEFVYMLAGHTTSTSNRQRYIPTSIPLLQNMVSSFMIVSQHHMYLHDATVQAVYTELENVSPTLNSRTWWEMAINLSQHLVYRRMFIKISLLYSRLFSACME
jgi:hypothetical protein